MQSSPTKVIHENGHYRVVVITVYQESVRKEVLCYGVENKDTGVVEHYVMSLTQAMTTSETENAAIEREWWKKQASKEIDVLSSVYETKMNS